MDLLQTTRLVNYFDQTEDVLKVNVSPILMQKGTTQLALYGLSHIHDNRLSRLFRETKVTMDQPVETTGEWFNVMILHQNRVDRGRKNYVPEEILPEFLDFVLWGHEHDCRIIPEKCPEKDFFVCQPGSSVATSLCEGEALTKHIGVLYVRGNEFKLETIKLQTVRPFVFKSIDLDAYDDRLSYDDGDIVSKVRKTAFLYKQIIFSEKLLAGSRFSGRTY